MNPTFSHRLQRVLLVALLAMVMCGEAHAHVPLTRSMVTEEQQQAPECLRIEVVASEAKVTAGADEKTTLVKLRAKVTAVEHSATHLKAGDLILIRYALQEPKHLPHIEGGPGPDMPEVPTVGTKCPAFLRQDLADRSVYSPAARWLSFFDKESLSQ